MERKSQASAGWKPLVGPSAGRRGSQEVAATNLEREVIGRDVAEVRFPPAIPAVYLGERGDGRAKRTRRHRRGRFQSEGDEVPASRDLQGGLENGRELYRSGSGPRVGERQDATRISIDPADCLDGDRGRRCVGVLGRPVGGAEVAEIEQPGPAVCRTDHRRDDRTSAPRGVNRQDDERILGDGTCCGPDRTKGDVRRRDGETCPGQDREVQAAIGIGAVATDHVEQVAGCGQKP